MLCDIERICGRKRGVVGGSGAAGVGERHGWRGKEQARAYVLILF